MGQAVARISNGQNRHARTRHDIAQSRVDLYTAIHKGMRSFMADTLVASGRMDPFDAEDVVQTLGRVRALLSFCRSHLEHENDFVHSAMEARRSGASTATAKDHVAHVEAIDALEGDLCVVELASGEARAVAALRLYRNLALFVAENLEHMHIEETENNAALWATHSDEELHRVHEALLASISPSVMELGLHWMLPSLAPAERATMLSQMQREAPTEVFDRTLGAVLPHLRERDRVKLMLALAPAPRVA